MSKQNAPEQDKAAGFAYATSAYFLWGFLPLYLTLLAHVPAVEVVVHRILWSLPLAALVLFATKRFGDLAVILRTPRYLAMGALTAAIISLNWGVYVWAIASAQALDAALGYYINPLFSVFLAAVLLGERLNRPQMVAIVLAALAVIVLTLANGRLPIAALALTGTWGAYAFFKKWLPIGPNQGFFLEVLLLTPPALGYIFYLTLTGESHFFATTSLDGLLLMGCGIVTAIPLILYGNGAKLLRLSTIGMLQYIAPTMIFIMAVFVLGEEFGRAEWIAFPLIWLALVIFTWSLFQARRSSQGPAASEPELPAPTAKDGP